MTLNENIRNLRLEKKLSQEKLGALLGVSAQAVSKWEQGLYSPDISLLPLLAECFGVTIDGLFQGVPARKYPAYGGAEGELWTNYELSGLESDFRRAVEGYEERILSGTASGEDYRCYGCLYELRASKDMEVALYNLRRAVREGDAERGRDWLIARRCLSELLLKLHKGEEVLSDYKKWVEEEPENVTAICCYTWALQRMGRKEEAWSVLETAIKIDEHNDAVLEGAGDLCWGFGRYEEAISYYDRISKDSESISHLFSKAEVLALMGEKEKAIQQFEQILVWLEEKGYNLEVEGQHPRERIADLSAQN